jgi:hypothetical protein
VKRLQAYIGAAITLGAAAASVHAEGLESLQSALQDTKPLANFRLRSESVDQDGMNNEASAVTLRGRLGFQTGKAFDTSFLAEGEYIWPLVSHYNSTLNGNTQYPTISDPETAEVNRFQLTNTSLPGTSLSLGRQAFAFDDSRFVADSVWRQNEQTYDAFLVTNSSVKNLTFNVAYLNQVNRNVGKDSPVGRYTGDSYLSNVSYKTPIGKIAAFNYLLDFDQAPRDSSSTTGVRFSGDKTVSKVKIGYSVSYASQRDSGNNPLDYSDTFKSFELSGAVREYTVKAGTEFLGGDGVKGFATPLASLHSFEGWADKFGTTPVNGLENRYVSLGYAKKAFGFLDSVAATTKYHSFKSERTSATLGDEIDLMLQAKWHSYSGMLKLASYHADTFATDTTKFFLQLEYVL